MSYRRDARVGGTVNTAAVIVMVVTWRAEQTPLEFVSSGDLTKQICGRPTRLHLAIQASCRTTQTPAMFDILTNS
jgi:hypothetical protein